MRKGACNVGMNAIQTIFQNLFLQISNMKITDVIDILAVAFLIFNILPLFRGSNTLRILRVIVVVFLVGALAEVLNLYTINYLIDELMTVGLIALVVLFQPELRRLLDHLGNVRLRNILGVEQPHQEMDMVISQTVMACEQMSKEKVGALIVFARDNSLDEYCNKGTTVDAQVSEQLLRNIFFPKAALHDGAMIIRNGRVNAAGCVLPLSDSKRLSADLGTRHRAGVGMSEVSDAVVVIVSEETGTISVAVGGMLKRHLAAKTLSRLLHQELCPEPAEQEKNLAVRLRQKLKKDKNQEDTPNEK